MTEEQKLKQAPGCGTFIIGGLIIIVLLSLVGIIFPLEILPYPSEVLIGVLVVGIIALAIALLTWRRRVKDAKEEQDNQAENLLRTGLTTLGDKDDEASKLAEKYKTRVEK